MTATEYNHLPKQLKNHYILARHGFSLANNDKLICSNPDIAIPEVGGPRNTGYGLHEIGIEQVEASAKTLAEHLGDNKKDQVKVYCSPFLRTKMTAQIFSKGLGITAEPTPNMALRERFYGKLDMTSDENYKLCWIDDNAAPDHGENSQYGIESTSSVVDRTTQFIVEEIEAKLEGQTVLLVAHGDVVQCMMTAFRHIEAWRHRELKHVDTANWRDMVQEQQEQGL